MSREIVAGVDGSPESLAAADWAAREALHRGLPLRLAHAWRWEPLDLPLLQDPEDQQRAAHAVLREAEATIAERHPGLALTAEVLPDTPVAALLGTEDRAELLVIGSRGRGAVTGFLLGSYGQQIIAAATRPVVAVRSRDGEQAEPPAGYVLVGQLGSPEDSAAALGVAFETAAARGAAVRAVRAWSLPPLYAYSPASMRLADEAGGLVPYEEKALREALAPWRERYPDVPVVEHVELGSAGQVLLSASGGAQLLVVGRRARRGAVGPRIGSVAHAALHLAPCPVAVVPQG
ncbi:universal stress protein [Streptomyces tanashiensis]|uniref:Universal stress protein n=1 Tax=Streptomyces tanashiensis TaxID=67367 RepID=A0ABY6R610_9ACTN|nr:universal stress protein [Streptomyces tanashiensis]UZX25496.1 universal stress protein [Streptomyces tanashiensis]GGT23237.1 universal stress protein [Streptomyces tanashiensis]GGY26364.1 universal stress protein [Streptomyces tanashiensis]